MSWLLILLSVLFLKNIDGAAYQTAKLHEAGLIDRDTMMDSGALTQIASHAILEIDSFVVLKPQQVFQLTKTLIQGTKSAAAAEAGKVVWQVLSLNGNLFSQASSEHDRDVKIANLFLEAMVQLGCVFDKWKTARNGVWTLGKNIYSGVTGLPQAMLSDMVSMLNHFGLQEVRTPPSCSTVPKEYVTKIGELLHMPGGMCAQICQCGPDPENICQVGEQCEANKCIEPMSADQSERLVQTFKSQIGTILNALKAYFLAKKDSPQKIDDAKAILGGQLYVVGGIIIKALEKNSFQAPIEGLKNIGRAVNFRLKNMKEGMQKELQQVGENIQLECASREKCGGNLLTQSNDPPAKRRISSSFHISPKNEEYFGLFSIFILFTFFFVTKSFQRRMHSTKTPLLTS